MWEGVSGDFQHRANSVSKVDGVSDMVPACWLRGSVGGRFRQRTVTFVHLEVRQFSFFLYVSGAFQAATMVLEAQRE